MFLKNIYYAQWIRLSLTGVLLLVSFLVAFAQKDADPDSLKNVLRQLPANSESYFKTQVNLANYYIYYSLDSADHYVSAVLNNPQAKQKLPKNFSRHYLIKSWVHQGRMQLGDAKHYLFEAMTIAKEFGTAEELLEIQINLGSILVETKDSTARDFAYSLIHDVDTTKGKVQKTSWILGHQYLARILADDYKFKESLQVILEAKEASFLAELPDYRRGVLSILGDVLQAIGDYSLSKKYLKEALELPSLYDFEKKELLFHLVDLSFEDHQLDSCLYFLAQIKALELDSKPERWQWNSMKARLAILKRKPEKAWEFIAAARLIVDSMQNETLNLQTLFLEGEISTYLANWIYLEKTVNTIKTLFVEYPTLQTTAYSSSLAELELLLSFSRKDPALIVDFWQYRKLIAENTRALSDKRLKELVTAYEAEQKEQENKLLRQVIELKNQTNKAQRLGLWLLTATVFGAITVVFFGYRNLRLTRAYNALLREEKQQLIFEKKELRLMNTQLKKTIQKNRQQVSLEVISKIEIKSLDKVHFIAPENTMYLKAEDEGTRVYLKDGLSIWTAIPLKKVFIHFPEKTFIQIFRSIAININFIRWVNHKTIQMVDGVEHKIGRNYKKAIFEKLS